MTSFLTEAHDIKVHNLLKKIEYKNRSFYMLCLQNMPSEVTGNKAWKLKYNIEKVVQEGYEGILTFGGAYSNHIYQTAIASQFFGLKCIGIIRGDPDENNPTINSARAAGMQIEYLNRSVYGQKTDQAFLSSLRNKYPGYYIIPEGGTNEFALKGTKELGMKLNPILSEAGIQNLGVSVGTGGTIAGIINGIKEDINVIGFGALKGKFLKDEIEKWIESKICDWTIEDDQEFGGYAKWKPELVDFISDFFIKTEIILDPIYTGKMMYKAMITERLNESWLYIHTGGLQGNIGFNQRFGLDLPTAE